MINVTQIRSAGRAAHYYDQVDDYYRADDLSPSRWYGELASDLGLDGSVDPEEFTQLLSGRLPDGKVLAGAESGVRKPGYDVTLSADKSVSLLALASSPEIAQAVTRAHEAAVGEALDYLQAHMVARVRNPDGTLEVQPARAVAVAAFRHATSREQQPDLHTHAIFANAVQTPDGKIRALEGTVLFSEARYAAQLYQNELAAGLTRAGIAVDRRVVKHDLSVAAVRGMSEALREHFSTRARQIEAHLTAHGLSRREATRRQREAAALATRRAKHPMDHTELRAQWREEARALGRAKELAVERIAEVSVKERRQAAETAIARAAERLIERDARVDVRELARAAQGLAIGTGAAVIDIQRAVAAARARGALVDREIQAFDRVQRRFVVREAFTTPTAIENEQKMLAAERRGRGRIVPLVPEERVAQKIVEAHARASAYPWTESQRSATLAMLLSADRVDGIQGYAGTAKTTTVLRTLAEEAVQKGYAVYGLAPTRSATDRLREGAAIADDASMTVQRYLAKAPERVPGERRLLLVDEASLLSASDMRRLLDRIERDGDSVRLVGDVRQLGSVEAGDAFRQLQESGMRTVKLEEIVRQQTPHAREAVEATLRRDAARAIEAIERQGPEAIREIADVDKHGERQIGAGAKARREALAQAYLALSPEERSKTLLIDPSREGRKELNKLVRKGLKREGILGREDARAAQLERKDLPHGALRDVAHFQPGDTVIFSRNRSRERIQGGAVYRVVGSDQKMKTVTVEKDGELRTIRPERIGRGKLTLYTVSALALAEGDKVAFTRNDRRRGLQNGDQGVVTSVDRERHFARVQFAKRAVAFDLREPQAIRYEHGVTAHVSQGRDASRVLAHAEAFRGELINNRSFYVMISRAKREVRIVTDDRKALVAAIRERSGDRERALGASVKHAATSQKKHERNLERNPGLEYRL